MNDQQQAQPSRAEMILDRRVDKDITAGLTMGAHGNLDFANLNQIMEVARVVAVAGVAIPKHLRENVGACLAVCIRASEWQLSPFAVADKTYVVNDRLAFEAQLINSVILKRAPIKGRFKISYSGEGEKRRCKVRVMCLDGEEVEYESPEIGKIPVKNSPLWKGDPDQQIFYYSSRAMCRRHFPDVLLGIYTPDEVTEETLREITPIPGKPAIGNDSGLKTIEAAGQPQPEQRPAKQAKPPTREEQMQAHTPTAEQQEQRAAGETDVQEQPEGHEEEERGQTGTVGEVVELTEPQRVALYEKINKMRDDAGITMADFKKRIAGLGWAGPNDMVNRYPAVTLQEIETNWQRVVDFGKDKAAAE